MKIAHVAGVLSLVSSLSGIGQSALATLPQSTEPYLPDASGFGTDTPAGRGGRVLRVTNLEPRGPGSLRAALAEKGPRIVVFEVGGVIDLERTRLTVDEPYLTVAGQTAPSPGITLIRGSLFIATHDVFIQHLRVRPGDAGEAKRTGWEPDGISTSGGEAHDIVIDHCSISWAVDENLSASGERTRGPNATSHRVTFRHCFITEGLDDSSHSKGPHSKGSLIHDDCRDIAIIGNLYAHNVSRNPLFKAFATGVVVNNVIYNPGAAAISGGIVPSEWAGTGIEPKAPRFCVVGNTFIPGQDTRKELPFVSGRAEVFFEDNLVHGDYDPSAGPTPSGIRILDRKPLWPRGLVPLPAKKTLEFVLAQAGARPRDRDEVDRRIVRDLLARQGRIIDSQEEVGGYPAPTPTRRPLEIPEQGVERWLHSLAKELE